MSHWAENHCDECDRPIHPNQGALCDACGWVREGFGGDAA